jgi:hypothetical protein
MGGNPNPSGQDVKHGDSMTTRKEREEFISLIYEHTSQIGEYQSGARSRFAQALMHYGASLKRIAENQCNGYHKGGGPWARGTWDGVAEDADLRKKNRICAKVAELCAQFACKPVFGGDPRGATLKIQVPDGYSNDFGGEGICVPTS